MSIAGTFDPRSTNKTEFAHTRESLQYVVTHLCLPVKLPFQSDYTLEMDVSLARAVCAAAHAYTTYIPGSSEPQWNRITRMLDNLQVFIQSEHRDRDLVISQLRAMRTGDILAFLIRPQNSATILTKREDCTLFESFEVSLREGAAEGTTGSLPCSYPGSAVEIPNELLDGEDIQSKLANVLSCPDIVNSDLLLPPLPQAQYTTLFSCVWQGIGHTVDVPHVVKRVHKDARRSSDRMVKSVWRRSSVWLLIRVATQMSLDRTPLGRASYKGFILFFICTIARDTNLVVLSTHLLYSIASKIIRRLGKLSSSAPDWLSKLALRACAGLREILDARWSQLDTRTSPFRNPSQDELIRDIQLSLEHSDEYIRNALSIHAHKPVNAAFHPSHRRRGTLDDFLSSNGAFFNEAYRANPEVAFYDVEKSVEQEINDWIACVTDVDEASAQLEILMDKYLLWNRHPNHPERRSIVLLTGIELFIALDRLFVQKIPILANYSPEIPVVWLEQLMLRRTTSLHRLSCAYQYLSARHSQSRSGWSVLSSKFTEDSFPVRYYDQSLHHQQLKGRIEEDAMVAGDRQQGDQQHPHSRWHATGTGVSQLPLPALPFHAKVVVYELQCPPCVRIWRSAVTRIWYHVCDFKHVFREAEKEAEDALLFSGPPLHVQFQFAYSPSQDSPLLRYAVRYPSGLSTWPPQYDAKKFLLGVPYSVGYDWETYVENTSHTSNDILAAQANCPSDVSLDEFIAFRQLRNGGSLQWINILSGLRSRTLNLRHYNFHCLLAQASFQVGPLDLNTGTWIWHQDLHEPPFCSALLDELESLFVEAGAGTIDGMMMGTISLLLTRVLASSPSEGVSERAVALLRRIRRKTFGWVQELLYNLIMAPTNRERSVLLWEMAATCRSTFDADSATLSKLCHSAEDVDTLISCALFIHTLHYSYTNYSLLLSIRDRRLVVALEETLKDAILADVSDFGIDLAISKTFTIHKPSSYRWEQLQHPNSRWLTCKSKGSGDAPSRTVHLNLLNGELRADGGPLGVLPCAVTLDFIRRCIFRDQGFFVIPSNLPGMDFTTLATTSKYKVHWAGQGDSLVVRAQCNESKDIFELVPSKKLEKDLPLALTQSCVHWLNLSTNIIEIRPLERLWEQSPDHWRIDCGSGQYRVYKGHETLVDIRSPTWAMVSNCFKCLNGVYENSSNCLLVTASPLEFLESAPVLRLSAAVTIYHLSFFVNAQGELESGDFKDMVYDENQCIGTLPGLENVLVLRQKAHLVEGLISRRVLIPKGFLAKLGDHRFRVVCDSWRYSASGEPSYHAYNVDAELGCLVGNGNSVSTGYLAHLHATTSCDWPDPLTGKIGAQAALCLFRSAGCRSIMNDRALDISAVWTSSRYPEIKPVLEELQLRRYWDRDRDTGESISELMERRAQAAIRQGPYKSWCPPGPPTLDDCNHDGSNKLAARVPEEPALPIPLLQVATLDWLLSERPAPKLPSRNALLHDTRKASSDNISELNHLFHSLPINKSNSLFEQEYIALLERSAQHICEDSRMIHTLAGKDCMITLEKHYVQCRAIYFGALVILGRALGPGAGLHERALDQFGQWPPVTADILFRYLASTSPFKLSSQWKTCLISFALLFLDLQRARRILLHASHGLEEEFSKELENEGCEGWCAEKFPDWLLIQIQGNFLIRRTQAEAAMAMMHPKSDENTVMQVNMGEGKSSVIIPIAAVALANGRQLVRVVVPKALTVQMFELLVSRLSGFPNRPIYYLPFSRSSDYDGTQIDHLHKLIPRCMAEHGILLAQPEHVASLNLMSVNKQIRRGQFAAGSLPTLQPSMYEHITNALLPKPLSRDSLLGNIFRSLSRRSEKDTARENYCDKHDGNARDGSDSASKWLSLRRWIHSHVRDILDESDEILRPRFQLIYTIGLQQHNSGSPHRWVITQQVLRLVKECAHTLSRNHPNFIDRKIDPPGSFPHVRIVRTSDVGQRLIPLIVEHVMAGSLPSINIQDIPDPTLQRAIRSFISDKDALQVPDTVKRVEEYAKRSDESCTWNGLLLLRGLLTSNILLFALTERRWRVDYGLDSRSQTMLAVPYRAKDMPAPNTQFGHPDVTIILTCLSYYYGGLTEQQLRTSFESLLDEDDPTTEYALWVKDYDEEQVPDSLRTLGDSINLYSSEQWDKVIFPLFSRNQATIDFYLSRMVFPKEAKEFPWKLSASSWDLAEKKEKVVTGFSGTNDSRWLLPTSIAQRDLDHQQGTNARALTYLLRRENNFYHIVVDKKGSRPTTVELLELIATQQPEIRVFLDVGAQILDCSNVKVAKAWLEIVRDAVGAVYFNDKDEPMVLMRNGTSAPMLSSPLSQQLDRCVVYLDQAHTRGTDVRLPIGSRAAVTLGPKVTKDCLVQGCMRMRKLGHGHSVMFFAPPEVDWSIRTVVGKEDPNASLTTLDILCWAIHETWTDIRQQAPYWAQQGMNHKFRYHAWSRFCNSDLTPEQLSDVWLQPEIQSLEELYAPAKANNASNILSALDPGIRQHCKDLGIVSLPSARIEEEQEREVEREKQREREMELPPSADPAEHFLHPDVVTFVKTGVIPPLHSRHAFRPVFTTLKKSSAASLEADVWSPFILATMDFCNTIIAESTQGTMDQYLRPVQWVLSSKNDGGHVLVLLSPFEAGRLLPDIRASECVHLHVYAPRTSQRMKPSDDLKLYPIPPLPSDWTPPYALIDQLNVFAGQLYLRDYNSYLRLCQFLGGPTRESPNDVSIRRNFFDIPGSFEENEVTFSGSPLPAVMALLVIRTRGRPFAHTHMGKILQGQPLREKDFEGPRSAASWTTTTCDDDTVPPSSSDAEYDLQDGSGSSVVLPSSERRLLVGTD